VNNLHLFELLNAGPGLGAWPLALARWAASGPAWLVALGMVLAWVQGNHAARRELLELSIACAMALALAQGVAQVWPQPSPSALHLGSVYLAPAGDAGLPSDQVTALWSLGLAALRTRRYAVWGLPLLTAGLVVGWSRVFLGQHFPFDVLAALPVALAGERLARALRRPSMPLIARVLYLYDRAARKLVAVLAMLRRA
jgi:undecaprenyl-diphosphatase